MRGAHCVRNNRLSRWMRAVRPSTARYARAQDEVFSQCHELSVLTLSWCPERSEGTPVEGRRVDLQWLQHVVHRSVRSLLQSYSPPSPIISLSPFPISKFAVSEKGIRTDFRISTRSCIIAGND